MEIFQENPKLACGCVTGIVMVVLTIGILAYCAGTVEPIQYGLKYNTISKNVDSATVYDGGWYIIGPFNKFLQFPKTQVNIDFANFKGSKATPLQARSDGLQIQLSFSFQYQLIREQIPTLYQKFNTRYEANIMQVARGVIPEIASSFNITDYWTNRTFVGDTMRSVLDSRLQSDAYARCTGFQLLSITLPDQREQSIIQTQVSSQTGFQMQYQQQASNIMAQIDVDISDANKAITIIQGNANALSSTIINEAEGYYQDKTINSQSQAYTLVSQITKQTAADTLMDYIYYTNLLSTKNATVLVGVDRAMLNLKTSGKGY